MLPVATPETSAVMDGLEPGSAHSYIVQPISYVEIADNVSPEYRVTGVSGGQSAPPAEGTAAVYEPARAAEPIAQPAQAGAEPAQEPAALTPRARRPSARGQEPWLASDSGRAEPQGRGIDCPIVPIQFFAIIISQQGV